LSRWYFADVFLYCCCHGDYDAVQGLLLSINVRTLMIVIDEKAGMRHAIGSIVGGCAAPLLVMLCCYWGKENACD
jgi:hypothetical protein